ncbi:MAG: SRPBCC family protein [Actinomycetota bacterium]
MPKHPVAIEVSEHIAAPPEVVWPYLVDWEHLAEWMKEGREFRLTSSQREGVGTRAEAVIRIGFITTVDPISVTRWEPPHLLEIEHGGWVKGGGTMRCVEADGGTQLWWRELLFAPLGLLGAVGMRLWTPLMRWTFRRDARLLKELVERESRGPHGR